MITVPIAFVNSCGFFLTFVIRFYARHLLLRQLLHGILFNRNDQNVLDKSIELKNPVLFHHFCP